jgi:lysophospholipase L1-like esterase
MRRYMIRALCGIGLLVGLIVVPAARPAGAASASVVAPKYYYLALGDSLAFGYQPNFDWSHGYAKYFYSNLQGHGAKAYVNYGCAGETAATFINGGCPYQNVLMLHNYYTGPQLTAALNFIKAHPGKISPVTIDIGANDVKSYVNTSTCAVGSYTSALQTFDGNFQTILTKLASALNGQGTILVMNYYDPYQNTCPNTVALTQLFNQHIAADASAAATAQNTLIPVADVFSAFETFDAFGNPVTPDPYLCGTNGYAGYTWTCSSYNDIHARDAGYSAIAQVFANTYGY